jgi:hypothetical protein
MSELILSEITRMKPGLCLIGLAPDGGGFRSVRPLPPRGHSWPLPFEYHRRDRLRFAFLSKEDASRPHVEDQPTAGIVERTGWVSESDLREHLLRAEMARDIRQLFRCRVMTKKRGAFAIGKLACRSICGVGAKRVRLEWRLKEIRASVLFPSGETLPDLPVVDHSWHSFAEAVLRRLSGPDRIQRLNEYFASRMAEEERGGRSHLLRIGLTRPRPNACWLMVDTLFPLPRRAWLEDLAGADAASGRTEQ